MSLISSVEALKCMICPFFEDYEYCFLDQNTKIEDQKSHPADCPLLDGRVVTIKVAGGKLIIDRDYV